MSDKMRGRKEAQDMAWRNYRPKAGNKYGAKKIELDGLVFDSKKEANRWRELQLLQRAGEISELERQRRFLLIPTQREPDTIGARGGIHKGRTIEHAVYYVADFVYRDKAGAIIVEDTKGMKTKDYIIKRKLMLFFHGIRITEV